MQTRFCIGLLGLLLAAAAASGVFPARAQAPPPAGGPQSPETRAGTSAVQVVQHGGYPELRVDGKPFFVHAAAFYYYRVPRDLWENSLERYRELGINTIDVPIPWNWHELREGEFDFDGHTNPRRDLRGLLRLVAEDGFKLIVRTGPVIGNHWRHGGYPEWLLARPEYHMDASALREGAEPPVAALAARDAEAAAQLWLANATHMAAAQKWLAAVGAELAPYAASRKLRVTQPSEKNGEPEAKEISGPLVFVQLDNTPALGAPDAASVARRNPAFWRYVNELRRALKSGGLDARYTINALEARETGARDANSDSATPPQATEIAGASDASAAKSTGITGRWFLRPQPPHPTEGPPGQHAMTQQDAAALEGLAGELKTQPEFPPLVSDFKAGWHAPRDDPRPPASAPANTLLGSRLLLAHGVHGLEYSPLQDTLAPAGYEAPGVNRYFRWDAGLDLAGNLQPRARLVARNGRLLSFWGEWLAASHLRADFGLADPRGGMGHAADPGARLERKDLQRIANTLLQVERVAELAGLTTERLDPGAQPVEQLLRHAVIFLPVFDPKLDKFHLSDKAQQTLAEYVRRGGALICFPTLPAGALFDQLSKSAGAQAIESLRNDPLTRMGLIVWGKDFYSWVNPAETFQQSRARFEVAWATQALREFLERTGVRPARKRSGSDLRVTQLVANEGAEPLGGRASRCANLQAARTPEDFACGQGLLSVTNLSFDEPVEEALEVLSPRAGARGGSGEYIPLRVLVPAYESLLLPLHYPLCSDAAGQPCHEEILAAGAELLHAERDGKTLELTFYTPARAPILLHLQQQPGKVAIEEGKLEGKWNVETHLLEVALPRGAAPRYLRVLKIHLHDPPLVAAKPRPPKGRHDFEAAVMDALSLPLGDDAFLPAYPPLVLLDQSQNGQLLFGATSEDETGREVSARIEGPVQGNTRLLLDPREVRLDKVKLGPAKDYRPRDADARAAEDGLLRSELVTRSGSILRSEPVYFATVGEGSPAHYRFDFDRDGAKEWVLESTRLRLIVSPASGGRVLALVDKLSGISLITIVGALGDAFTLASSGGAAQVGTGREREIALRGIYRAEWIAEAGPASSTTAGNSQHHSPGEAAGAYGLRMSYQAQELAPSQASIEKTLRLTGIGSVEADYRVTLAPQSAASAGLVSPGSMTPQAFLTLHSVATRAGGELGTRFCWETTPAGPKPAAGTAEKKTPPSGSTHCEAFVPGGPALEVPAGGARLEVDTPGRPGLVLEWNAGVMRIEPKLYSTLLKLKFPLQTGDATSKYQLRYTVLPAE